MRKCRVCSIGLNEHNHTTTNAAYGIWICKQCDKKGRQQRYLANTDKVVEKVRQYHLDNPEWSLWNKAKHRAKKEGREFSITVADIIIPNHCPYLDIKLTHILGNGQLFSNISLDRIDSTKGYIPGNVQVISRLANTMKSNADDMTLCTFAINVLRIHKDINGHALCNTRCTS